MQPLRLADDGWSIEIIDQTALPDEVVIRRLATFEQVVEAITSMRVRGAPLIGITAAYGACLGLMVDDSDAALQDQEDALLGTRPTAINLRAAVSRMMRAVPKPCAGRWPIPTRPCATPPSSLPNV